jgi:hypothetical protein
MSKPGARRVAVGRQQPQVEVYKSRDSRHEAVAMCKDAC